MARIGGKCGRNVVRRGLARLAHRTGLARLHRDERGGALECVMVMGAIAVPLMALAEAIFQVLSDYFGMIAFYVSWPFL